MADISLLLWQKYRPKGEDKIVSVSEQSVHTFPLFSLLLPILTPLSSSSRNFLVPSQLPAENTRRIVFRQLFLLQIKLFPMHFLFSAILVLNLSAF